MTKQGIKKKKIVKKLAIVKNYAMPSVFVNQNTHHSPEHSCDAVV